MSNRIIKPIYIYIESQLPVYGWFQKCFGCETITAKTMFIDRYEDEYISWEIYSYLCPKCNINKKNKNFLYEYYKFINEKYPEVYKVIRLNILNRNANIIQTWWENLITRWGKI
jgi:hypothetical protein